MAEFYSFGQLSLQNQHNKNKKMYDNCHLF